MKELILIVAHSRESTSYFSINNSASSQKFFSINEALKYHPFINNLDLSTVLDWSNWLNATLKISTVSVILVVTLGSNILEYNAFFVWTLSLSQSKVLRLIIDEHQNSLHTLGLSL